MRKLVIVAVAGALLATGGVVSAQGEAERSDAQPEKEKKICRTDKATGSLTRRTRICMTRAEWNELADRTRRGVGEMTSAASGGKQCVLDERGGC